jgi:hypothetical protein
MARLLLLLVPLLLAGCDDEKKVGYAPTATPVRLGMLSDDEPVRTEPALAIGTEGERSLRVAIPLRPLSCEALAKAYPKRPEGEFIDLWLRRPLEADGTEGPWSVRSLYLQDHREGRGLITRGAMIDDVLALPDGHKLVGLELAAQDQKRLWTWTGDLVVKDCGRVPRPEPDHPQPELSISLSGQRIPIHGATLRPEAGKLYVRLTRAPHGCNTVFTEGYDFYLDFAFEGEPPRLAFAALQGDAFPADPSGSLGRESFVVESDAPLAGSGDLELTLRGKLELGSYPLVVAGKALVKRCTLP